MDLFAAWTVGATAACLDNSLSEGELQRLMAFTKAAALCIDHETIAPNDLRIPVLKLADAPTSTGSTDVAALDPGDPALVLFTLGGLRVRQREWSLASGHCRLAFG
jgi:hypothetical protein